MLGVGVWVGKVIGEPSPPTSEHQERGPARLFAWVGSAFYFFYFHFFHFILFIILFLTLISIYYFFLQGWDPPTWAIMGGTFWRKQVARGGAGSFLEPLGRFLQDLGTSKNP